MYLLQNTLFHIQVKTNKLNTALLNLKINNRPYLQSSVVKLVTHT